MQLDLLHAQVRDLLVLRHLLISLGQTHVDNLERGDNSWPVFMRSYDFSSVILPVTRIHSLGNEKRFKFSIRVFFFVKSLVD